MELLKGNTMGTLDLNLVPTKQQRIAELAKQSPQMGFTPTCARFSGAEYEMVHYTCHRP